jgi:hypothetical protein
MIIQADFHGITIRGSDKPGIVLNAVAQIRRKDRGCCVFTWKERKDFEIPDSLAPCPLSKSCKKSRRLCNAHAVNDSISAFHPFHCLPGAGRLLLVLLYGCFHSIAFEE